MNFDETLASVNTIIHEMGHSMNSYYINKKQDIYSGVSIFCAEIASIVNETLLAYNLLNKNASDKDLCKEIISNTLGEFFGTTTRQIIFSNFEYEIVNLINEGKPVTKDIIFATYKAMNEKYTGKKYTEKMQESKYFK
jgi:oligoendopeptidase F